MVALGFSTLDCGNFRCLGIEYIDGAINIYLRHFEDKFDYKRFNQPSIQAKGSFPIKNKTKLGN